ncbi:hypothetical protein D9615_006578 [Tricholomella constricta]|uniref:Uncharacterized protein n=1 Tax=Tricholomella constricta TaxID=117010 RepID=A0A8H5HA58_9AGAR|nr:hypothetical protein D9615_006578 [Tricholomella constricta]
MPSMWPLRLLAALSVLSINALSYTPSDSHVLSRRQLHARGYVTEDALAGSYDFVIVGGGLAGLVLAARLTENLKTTVLVLEAGDSGDALADRINTPSGAYYESLLYTPNDWQYKTVDQPQAGNRRFDWPRGKILGGSSAVNAMYLVRPSEIEVNAWESLMANEDAEAAKKWGWDEFYPAMKKTETFTPPSDEVAQIGNITWSAATHGTSGPMQVSYPGMCVISGFRDLDFDAEVGGWAPSLEALGLPPLKEPNGGVTLGSLVGPSWINPSNWTRSYSKAAYLDPALSRSNLAVVLNSMATRIIFADGSSGDLRATGVEFASSPDGPRMTVNAKTEVILSGGVVGSPQLLMLSGVGPKDVLEAAGVEVKVDLPGVGQHVQDHLTAPVVWTSTGETAGDIQQAGSDFAKTKEFLSFINSATAFANLTRVFGTEGAAAFQKFVADGLEDSASKLVPSQSPEVIEGYKAIYDTIANKIFNTDVAVLELLLALNTPGEVSVQAALQHPLSQGRLYINTSSPFDAPIIDPQYFSHPADLTIMREGIKLVRALKQTPPFNSSLGDETFPGPTVVSDEDIEKWLIEQASTQYHPISSCAMLPRSQGGVVNAKLQVYGLANVRVVDSSIFPFEFASHVGASTYGLAEQASSIILISNNLPTNAVKGLAVPSFSTLALVWTSFFAVSVAAGPFIT